MSVSGTIASMAILVWFLLEPVAYLLSSRGGISTKILTVLAVTTGCLLLREQFTEHRELLDRT